MKLSESITNIFETIVDFITELQYKDDVKALENESQESLSSAAIYLSAFLRTDNRSEADREHIISTYVELNPYYKALLTDYNIPPHTSRLAKDMDIIYQPEQKVVTTPYLYHYRSIYKECLNSFYITSYSQAMVNKTQYREFCLLSVNLMALMNLLNKWLETPFDIDLMDEAQIDKFMYSFGISYFRALPLKYKQAVARNLNRLIRNKGTDKVIIDILEIFSFKDIDIYKYYLVRSATSSDVEKGDLNYLESKDRDVHFLAHSIRVPSLNKAIKSNNYRKFSFERITGLDPLWQTEKNEVASLDFDYIQTKYFSIETGFELGTESINTVLMLNLIKNIRENYPTQEFLSINSSLISESQAASIEDIIITLQILTCEYQNIVDNINYELEGIAGVSNFANSDLPLINEQLIADNPSAIPNTNSISLINMDNIGTFDIKQMFEIYNHNINSKLKLEELMAKETDYKKYKRLKNAYNAKFIQKLSYELFNGAETFTDYLRARNGNLVSFIDKARVLEGEDKQTFIEESISNLTDVVNGALNKFGLFLGTTSLNIVVGYLKQVISAFKSFTVSLKDLDIFVVMRENYQTKFVDELNHMAKLLFSASQTVTVDKQVFNVKLMQQDLSKLIDLTKMTLNLKYYDNSPLGKDSINKLQDTVKKINASHRILDKYVKSSDKMRIQLANMTIAVDKFIGGANIKQVDRIKSSARMTGKSIGLNRNTKISLLSSKIRQASKRLSEDSLGRITSIFSVESAGVDHYDNYIFNGKIRTISKGISTRSKINNMSVKYSTRSLNLKSAKDKLNKFSALVYLKDIKVNLRDERIVKSSYFLTSKGISNLSKVNSINVKFSTSSLNMKLLRDSGKFSATTRLNSKGIRNYTFINYDSSMITSSKNFSRITKVSNKGSIVRKTYNLKDLKDSSRLVSKFIPKSKGIRVDTKFLYSKYAKLGSKVESKEKLVFSVKRYKIEIVGVEYSEKIKTTTSLPVKSKNTLVDLLKITRL